MNNSKLIKEWMKYPTRILTLRWLADSDGKTCTEILKGIKITIRSQYNVLKYLEKNNLIYSVNLKDKNRYHIINKIYYLTDKGKVIANKLRELDSLLSNL